MLVDGGEDPSRIHVEHGDPERCPGQGSLLREGVDERVELRIAFTAGAWRSGVDGSRGSLRPNIPREQHEGGSEEPQSGCTTRHPQAIPSRKTQHTTKERRGACLAHDRRLLLIAAAAWTEANRDEPQTD